MNPPPDPLDSLLDRWAETPEPPPQLSYEVWQRIAQNEKVLEKSVGWRLVIESWFARPSFSVMFVASCALLGLFLAELRVNHVQRARSEQIARSYLQLIDPLLTAQVEEHHP